MQNKGHRYTETVGTKTVDLIIKMDSEKQCIPQEYSRQKMTHVPGETEPRDTRIHPATESDTQFKMHKLFMSKFPT